MMSAPACFVRIGRCAAPVAVGAIVVLFAVQALAQTAPPTAPPPSMAPSSPNMAPAPPQNATAPREEPPTQRAVAPPPSKRRSFDFSVPDFGSAPLRLDVARIEVVQAYAPPQRPPNVEHRMIVSPLATVDDWARRHIEAAAPGRDDSAAVFVIEDASVVVEKVRSRKNLLESLIREDSDKFTLRL